MKWLLPVLTEGAGYSGANCPLMSQELVVRARVLLVRSLSDPGTDLVLGLCLAVSVVGDGGAVLFGMVWVAGDGAADVVPVRNFSKTSSPVPVRP